MLLNNSAADRRLHKRGIGIARDEIINNRRYAWARGESVVIDNDYAAQFQAREEKLKRMLRRLREIDIDMHKAEAPLRDLREALRYPPLQIRNKIKLSEIDADRSFVADEVTFRPIGPVNLAEFDFVT